MTVQSQTAERASLLGTLSQRTRAVALVALIAEALFLTGALLLPEGQRIYAFAICAVLLVLAIAACAWLESKQVIAPPVPDTPLLTLPVPLQHKVIVIDDQTKAARGQLADIYRTGINLKLTGRFEEAIRYFQQALKLDPEHTKSKYNIASCTLYLKRFEEAEERFKTLAAELKPRLGNLPPIDVEILHGCYIQLNDACSEQKQFVRGVPFLIESLRVKPDDALSYLNLAIATFKGGNTEEAKKWYRALFDHPDQLSVLTTLSEKDKAIVDGLVSSPNQEQSHV